MTTTRRDADSGRRHRVVAAWLAARPRKRRQPPPQPPAAAAGRPFRAGVELVSLNVTVTEGAHYVTDLDAGRLQRVRGRRQAGRHVLQPAPTCRSRSRCCSTRAPAWTPSCPRRRKPRSASPNASATQDLAEVIDFDSRVVVLQNFTNNAAELEQAIRKTSAGGSTSLYNAVYIALKDLKKVVARNAEEIRRQAIVVLSDGEDTSSLLPFEEVLDLAKRSETAIYTIGLRDERRHGSGSEAVSRKRSSCCASSRRKRAAGRSSRIRSPSWPASTARSPTSCRASTRSATRRRTRKRDGAWRRVVVRVDRPDMTRAHQAGLLRADDRRADPRR